MLYASAAFTAMVSLVKVARVDFGLDAADVVAWRSLLGLPVAVWFAWSVPWTVQAKGTLLARCAFGFAAMLGYFTAARALPVGELSAITQLQPILVALLAPWLLGSDEEVSPWIWGAIALGFTGTLAIAGPELGVGGEHRVGVLAALVAAVASAVAHTLLRRLGRTEQPRVVVLWFQFAAVFGALCVLGRLPVIPTDPVLALVLAGVGASAVAGQLLLTTAYQRGEAARIAAVGYVTPLMGFTIDVLLFATPPEALSLLGAGLVIAAGLLLLKR